MDAKQMTRIYSAGSFLKAMAVQEALQRAGIPAAIRRSESGYDLMALSAWAGEAQQLLNPQPRTGEVYFPPSIPVRLNWTRA